MQYVQMVTRMLPVEAKTALIIYEINILNLTYT